MNRIVLTEEGQKIITQANIDGGSKYWVGYFGLAYVPEPSATPLAERKTLVDEGENGDYIYNIWQGDLTGTGNASAKADSGFTGLTAYDNNLSANFRYVYDPEHLCNRLVAWETEGEAAEGVKADSFRRKGYAVYEGCKATESTGSDTDMVQFSTSSIPVPAPLLYLGSSLDYSRDLGALSDSLESDWPLMEVSGESVPRVTPDMRCYGGNVNPASPGTASIDQLVDSETARADQYVQDGCMANYANMVSASVYNKGHCQVSSEGYETDFQESCHNMSRVTKLFPISQYEVADVDPETKSGRKGDASTIKYHLSLDFKGLNATYNDVLNFHGEGSELYDGSYRNSFKFNRIGIYAAPVSIRRFRKEGGCDLCQVEVEPEKNPVLVAIITVDEVLLSEDGSLGFTSWSQDFILNMTGVPADSGSLVRDVEVYYNLAENEAITWYQNQLLATAGLSEAVTTLGIDVAYLKNMAPAASYGCCQGAQGITGTEDNTSIQPVQMTLKNLVDATNVGAVRGSNSLASDGYGESSFTMGFDSQTTGDFAITNGPYALNDGDFSINIGPSTKNYGEYSINIGWSSAINNAKRSINIGGGTLESSITGNIIQVATSGGLKEASSNSLMLTTGENIDRLCRSVILTGDTTTGTVETDNVITDTLWIGADSDKLSGAKVSQSVMIGTGNDCDSKFILNQVFSVGDNHIRPTTPSLYDGQATINRTTIIGLNHPVIGYALTEKEQYGPNMQDLCTHTYSDAHIFLNSEYWRIPELFGIFPGPTIPRGSDGTGAEDIRNQYMPLQRDAFEYDDNVHDYKYAPQGASPGDPTNTHEYCDAWARGRPLTDIRAMINKPSVPMIYTGGIALAGNAIAAGTYPDHYGDEPYAGRLKLGSGVLPTAYIVSHSVASWSPYQRFIIPTSITGTTICPFGRMKLGITDVQDLDGTLHIGLFRDAGMTTNYYGAYPPTGLAPAATPSMGGVYVFNDGTVYELKTPTDNYNTGDEFIAVIESGSGIEYAAIGNSVYQVDPDHYSLEPSTIQGPGKWLFRVATYTYTVNSKSYSMYGYIALPIGGEESST